MAHMLGTIAQQRGLTEDVYIYNENSRNQPDGPKYMVHPKSIYIRELKEQKEESSKTDKDDQQQDGSTTVELSTELGTGIETSDKLMSSTSMSSTSLPRDGWDSNEYL